MLQLYDKMKLSYGRVTLGTINQCITDDASIGDVLMLSDNESSFGETICVR
jgi:hypothetical protein